MDFFEYEDSNLLRRAVNWLVQIAVVIALAWFCVYAYGNSVINVGQSMQPVLEDGDGTLMDRVIFHLRDPRRFDVIVFKTTDGKENIKRIIGLPGETVKISGGRVLINGKPLPDDENNEFGDASLAGLADSPVELDEGEYFVMGDNRDASEDSRFDSVGNVKREMITGKIWIRISPFIRIHLIR
jgi:signal peptidase I